MRRLRKWIRRPKAEEDTAVPPPPPFLPAAPDVPRAPPRKPVPQVQSLFFRLPPELRRAILGEAFGDRTIHIDLGFRPRPDKGHDPGHPSLVEFHLYRRARNGRARRVPGGGLVVSATTTHRLMRWNLRFRCGTISVCVGTDVAARCGGGLPPRSAGSGSWAFLLSYKQGYEEATDVMYSTNTIYLQAEPIKTGLLRQYLIPNAPVLTGPAIHGTMSLVMTWDFTLFGSYCDSGEAEHRARFTEHLELLPRAFPKLTHLRLILEDQTYYRTAKIDSSLDEVEAVLFRPILEARRQIKGLRDMAVLTETAIFDVVRGKAWKEGLLRRSHNANWTTHVWYPFTVETPADERRRPDDGYWIETGPESNLGWRPDGTSFLMSL